VFDESLFDENDDFKRLMIGRLQEQFDADKSVKIVIKNVDNIDRNVENIDRNVETVDTNVETSSKCLNIPNSVQWLTAKTDDFGKKVRFEENIIFLNSEELSFGLSFEYFFKVDTA
jgi:hypothetical protein